jgi:hypothetical protein
MEDRIFDINLTHEGKAYTGWVNPSGKTHSDGLPSSFHVVLNDVFFANLSYNNGKWVADDQRPAGLIEAVGKAIESKHPAATK